MANRSVLGTCHHDCPDSCGWVVTVEDGVATRLRGNPDHPYSKGELCPKVNAFLDRVYSPDRVLHPLRRTGPKGSGQFERIGWDEALATIAAAWTERIDRFGPETLLPYNDAGTQGHIQMNSLSQRLFTTLGASRLEAAICGPTAAAGVAATLGTAKGLDPETLRHSRFLILWGTNTKVTNRHFWPIVEDVRAGGGTVVVIDPIRTATAEAVDWFVQPLPGTDAALALAMMHVLWRDGLVDQSWVDAHTTGFDRLVERLREWPPERAATVCGLEVDEIVRLARAYGATRPAAIRMLIGAEHREHGAMLFRTVACLPALVGAWRDLGGGLARSVGTYLGEALADYDDGAYPGALPRLVNMSRLGEALTSLSPPVTALMVWGVNPLVIVPNAELVREGFAREDLFTVVHEQFLTDTARYADIVLPATTQIEQLDIVPPWGHLHLGWNEPAIEPLGEAVPNTELMRRLAGALGLTDPRLFDDDETLIRHALSSGHPWLEGVNVERLRAEGHARLALPVDYVPYAAGGFGTPDGRVALYSSALAAAGHDPLPQYQPAVEGPHGDPDLADRYPLVLATTKSQIRFLNASYSHLPKHGAVEGEPLCHVSAVDADARGIVEGATVRVFNDRSSLELRATISQRVRPGLVSVPFGWWRDQHRDGKVANSLTSDMLTAWGGGVAFHDTLVQVALAE